MNDRQLRNVIDGLGGRTNGMPREDGYDITVASEIMAVLCLASDITDLKNRLSKMIIGYTYGKVSEQKPVTAVLCCLKPLQGVQHILFHTLSL